jgi:hypothetical protein
MRLVVAPSAPQRPDEVLIKSSTASDRGHEKRSAATNIRTPTS